MIDHEFSSSEDSPTPGSRRESVAEPPFAASGRERAGTASGNGHADDESAQGRGPAAFQRLIEQFQELRDQFVLLCATKIDGIKLSAQRLVLAVILGLLGLTLAATYLVTSLVLVIVGIGEGLGNLFGDRLWLGNLTAGLVLLVILALGIGLGLRHMTRASRERTVLKYARRSERQATRGGSPAADKPTNAN